MRTYYLFQSRSAPDLRAFTDEPTGSKLPADDGPWALIQEIAPGEDWKLNVGRKVVAAAILENGFFLWGPRNHQPSSKPIIESDRVEGTAVFGRDAGQIGTIKRLLIEKVSGRVIDVDVTFGGFLGIGAHHHTIPWDKLRYDRELGGYRTDITEEQVRGAPQFLGDAELDREHERSRDRQRLDYWNNLPRGPI
jgi:hypothetical protein